MAADACVAALLRLLLRRCISVASGLWLQAGLAGCSVAHAADRNEHASCSSLQAAITAAISRGGWHSQLANADQLSE